ncbi:LL-diaminopimelate aminotransferase, partial [candidate division WOR-3 bacterium]|nr:LL-diaminopimelate aminotransferase [candidate division WOR-3 bacterium]
MIHINENYLKLKSSYLFAEIEKRVSAFRVSNPDKVIISLGIGDVTRALPEACISAFREAVGEMSRDDSFRGYGPYKGYSFLRDKIAEIDFKSRGADISPDEIFISDGAKCDTGNIQELFSLDSKVAVPDPVYPVYVDTNVMAGRTGKWEDGRYDGLIYLDSNEENNFVPTIPSEKVDLIYLCFPNNPTGATIDRDRLKKWVDYAKENNALILYDAAYEAFIQDDNIPKSIYEITGAKDVAIEFRSFSKTAGFTGTRCAYTIIPKKCMAYDKKGKEHSVHDMWERRQTTKFNGVSYPVQRAAEAVYTEEGQEQVCSLIDYYLKNAKTIRKAFEGLGYKCNGGDNSPYIWVKTGKESWKFFDLLLKKANIICTPGSGFGRCGKGYIRISSFNSREKVEEA